MRCGLKRTKPDSPIRYSNSKSNSIKVTAALTAKCVCFAAQFPRHKPGYKHRSDWLEKNASPKRPANGRAHFFFMFLSMVLKKALLLLEMVYSEITLNVYFIMSKPFSHRLFQINTFGIKIFWMTTLMCVFMFADCCPFNKGTLPLRCVMHWLQKYLYCCC